MKNWKVSIIIPNYNTDWLLEKNIPVVLKALRNKKNHIKEIIVVDDASPDKSVRVLKTKFPEVKVIKHKKNRGFSSSVNTGVRSSKGNLIALLNTDVLPAEDFLEAVFKHFEEPKTFAVSLSEKNYSWAKGEFVNGFMGHKPGEKTKKPHDTFWVSGGSGVFRKDLWTKLGGMDENLFSPFYWEDLDFSYRAVKRGYRLIWEPKAKVEHKHETTMAQISKKYLNKIKERNHLTFMWKNVTSPQLFRRHLEGLIKRLLKNPGYFKIVLINLFRIGKILKARRKEIKESKVSDEAILAKF